MISRIKSVVYVALFIQVFSTSAILGQNPDHTAEFEYTIEGIVKDGEGIKLAFYTSDENLDERRTTIIEDGKFSFKGKAAFVQQAFIRFEEDIVENKPAYRSIPIFLEPGTTTIQFNYIIEHGLNSFSDFKILKGQNNLIATEFYEEYGKAMGGGAWIFGDSVRMDSMRLNVYPAARTRVLKVYDQFFEKGNSGLHLSFLKAITDHFESRGMFEKNQLSSKEINKIKALFAKIDNSLSTSSDYQIVQASIEQIENLESAVKFVDYELESLQGQKERLSSLLKKNKFTILDFWWTGCRPCRKFNKEMYAEYKELKSLGIEIIGLNVDDSRELWERSSLEDEIQWPNLYAGKTSDIQIRYRIRFFPTKIVYDSEGNYIDLQFKNKDELWDWVRHGMNKK